MTDIQTIYNILRGAGLTETGALAIMGNWKCESLLDPYRKQGDLSAAALPSHQYVAQVTSGQIGKMSFAQDQIGFGLAQWTFFDFTGGREGRKLDLWNFWKSSGLPLDSAAMQARFALWELTNKPQYKKLLNYLRTVGPDGLRNACDRVCREYEQPAYNNVQERYDAAVELSARLDLNDTGSAGDPDQNTPETDDDGMAIVKTWPPRTLQRDRCTGWPEVYLAQSALLCRGFSVLVDGIFGEAMEEKIIAFQKKVFPDQPQEWDGKVGPKTWKELIKL